MNNNLKKALKFIVGPTFISLSVFWSMYVLLANVMFPIFLKGPVLAGDFLAVSGKEGEGKIILTTKTGGPKIIMYDGQGNSVLSLSVPKIGGHASINIDAPTDKGARPRLLVSISTITRSGVPNITLFDPETGRPVWRAIEDTPNPVKPPDEPAPPTPDETSEDGGN